MLRSHIEELRRQRESLDRLIGSLTSILDRIGDSVANDEIIGILGSPCPHCPDYEEKTRAGRRIEKKAVFLAAPER